jgi:exodeoxyribonuclease V alpha subunit
VTWVDTGVDTDADRGPSDPSASTVVRDALVATAREVTDAARAGDGWAALEAMRSTQVLCGHRRGPNGVTTWRRQVEQWLAAEIDGYHPFGWYAGRPLLVTENDYTVELFNGDTGVVVAAEADAGDESDPGAVGGRLECAFERRGEIIRVSPSRLRAVETSYAKTIHKSQGSQFNHVIVALPDSESRILTRELLYTAITRARHHVTVIGNAEAIRTAVDRPVQRASGLTARLWS